MVVAMEIQCIGKVQGVYFRASTVDKAKSLKVCGFVRNEPDGSVFIHAEGEQQAIGLLVEWCYSGPVHAEVAAVNTKNVKVLGIETFEIRH